MGRAWAAEAEVVQMQWSTELEQLQDEDPELAEELTEMMDEEDAGKMFSAMAEWIGLVGYEIISVENGFKGTGWILPPAEE